MAVLGIWATVCLCTWWGQTGMWVLQGESPEEGWLVVKPMTLVLGG